MSICTSAAMSILQIWSTLSERLDKIYYSDPLVSFSVSIYCNESINLFIVLLFLAFYCSNSYGNFGM